jgi:hypothetical protein
MAAALPPADVFGQSLINLATVGAIALAAGAAERFLFPLDDEAEVALLLRSDDAPPLPDPNAPASPDDQPVVLRRYRWDFRPRRTRRVGITQRFSLTLPISEQRYRRAAAPAQAASVAASAAAGDGAAHAAYAALVTGTALEVDKVAATLRQQQVQRRLDPLDQAWHVLAFVQAAAEFRYDVEKEADRRGWPQHPIVTLHDGVGGDQDQAVLAAALLNRLGFYVALVLAHGRCALGLACAPGTGEDGYVRDARAGLSYCYGEATATGWRLGTIPEYLRVDPVVLVPVGDDVAPSGGAANGPT